MGFSRTNQKYVDFRINKDKSGAVKKDLTFVKGVANALTINYPFKNNYSKKGGGL